ncbi:MAG: hypothetical protein V1720_05510, partial [bacterium]
MNYYIVVEGEKASIEIYKNWIQFINPSLSYKQQIDEVFENDFYLIGGYGYPNYFQVIKDAIIDVNEKDNFDKLVVCIDSEENSFQEKYDEMDEFIRTNDLLKGYSIIIQHFCIETWFLGNRKIHSREISNPLLKRYKRLYDVHAEDPEYLPPNGEEELNRAQFAYKYFRLLLHEKYDRLVYNKHNPSVVINVNFFNQIK